MGKKSFKKRQSKSLEDRKKEQKEALKLSAKGDKQRRNEPDQYSVDQLLDKAEQLIDEFSYELAQKFCQRALEKDADNLRALETSASLLLELGNVESAKHCLGRAVELSPEVGFSKYMTLGQLMEGAMAVQCYQKGIELMLKEKEQKEAQEIATACSNKKVVTARDVSSAYCAVAEIYLTDCCFDESAEVKCQENVDKAVEADPDNPEALQLKANFLLSKNEKEEAREVIKKSVNSWLPKLQEADTATSAEEDFNPVDMCEVTYSTRIQCAKILIEVEEFELAKDVSETLLDEDEEVPDVWYLIGWANYLQGQEYYENARHYLQKAKEAYVKVKSQDAELLGHIDELLAELPDVPENSEDAGKLEEELEAESSEEEMEDQ